MKNISTRSKWMIGTSFLLSAALIVTLALGITKGSLTPDIYFAIGFIAFSISVFFGTLIVRLRKSGYTRRLSEDYYAQYEKVCDALGNSVMSKTEIQETKQDILSLMLEAQAQGKDVRGIVGDDTAVFIRSIQDSFGYRNHTLFNLLSVVQYGIFFLLAMQLLIFFEGAGRISFFDVTIELSMFVMFILIVLIIYPVTRSAMRKGKSALPFALPLAFGIGYIAVMVLLRETFYHVEWVRLFLDGETRMIGAWWLLALLAAAMAAAQCVKWVLRRRSLNMLRH